MRAMKRILSCDGGQRICYWVAILADGWEAVKLGASYFGRLQAESSVSTSQQESAIAFAAMIAWTVLLVWAQARIEERKGVFLLTIMATFGMLILKYAAPAHYGLVSWTESLAVLLSQAILPAVLGAAFLLLALAKRQREKQEGKGHEVA